jgi:type IV fimbrial biogenesis protein FimT
MRGETGRSAMNRPQGFTIIELIVTIAVLAILAAMAIPSFTDMMERQRLINATEAVYSDLQNARSEAVKRSQQIVVSIQDGCITAADKLVSPTVVLSNTCMTAFPTINMSTNRSPIYFDRVRGITNPTGGGGTITLTSSTSLEARVIISGFGRVRVCSPTKVGGYPTC